MNIRLYIDPETNFPHIHNHKVSEDEVKDILSQPGEDRPGREGSRIAIGQTQAGRYLRIVYVPDQGHDGAFVITAYDLRGKALLAYRRRRQRRKR